MKKLQVKSVKVGAMIRAIGSSDVFHVVRNETVVGSDGEALYQRVYLRAGDDSCRVTYLPPRREVEVVG